MGIDIEEKKALIDLEFKKYIILKLGELNLLSNIEEKGYELDTCELLQIFADNIQKKQHSEVLSNFIHYIIQVAGALQNYSIIWMEEDNKDLIESPLVEFNQNGLWTDLKTHKETDYVKTFSFVYDVFNYNFMTKNNSKKLTIGLMKSES